MSAPRDQNRTIGCRLRLANFRLVTALFTTLFIALIASIQTQGLQRRQSTSVSAADEAATLRLIRNYFDLLAKENSTGLLGLWSTASPQSANYRQYVEQLFVESDCAPSLPATVYIRAEAGQMLLQVPHKYTCADTKTGTIWRVDYIAVMSFVKEHGRWKIWQMVDSSAEFAAALSSKTEPDLTRLFVEERESLTIGLVEALVSLGNDYTNQKNYQQAVNTFQLALRVSKHLGYKEGVRDSLWGRGYALKQQQEYDKALPHYQQAISLSRELSDQPATAVLQHGAADIFNSQGDYPSALDHYKQSLTHYEQLRDKAKIGELLDRIGDVYYNLRDYPKALENYFNSLRNSEDFTLHRETLDDIADAYGAQNDHKTALAYRRKSLAPLEADESALNELTDKFFAINEPWDSSKWRSLWSSKAANPPAIEMPMTDDVSSGARLFPGSGKNNELTNYRIRRRVIWVGDGWAIVRLSLERKPDAQRTDTWQSVADKMERSLECVKEDGVWKVMRYYPATKVLAAELASADTEGGRNVLLEEEPDLVNLELTHELVASGNDLLRHRNYDKAREVYQLALNIADRFTDRSGVADKLTWIANTHKAQGEPDKALKLHQQSLAIRLKLGEQAKVAASQVAIAMVYNQQGDYEPALDYLQKANKLFAVLTDDEAREGVAVTWLLIGQMHLNRGEVKLAEDYFHKSFKLFEEMNDEDGMSAAWQATGQIHMLQGAYKRAMQAFQKSRDVSGDANASVNTLIGITYLAQGNLNLSIGFIQKSLPPPNAASSEQADQFAVAYNNFLQADYAQALRQFQQLIPQQEKLGNKLETGSALYYIGLIQSLQDNHTAGIESLQKSIRLFEQAHAKPLTAETLMYLAYAHEAAKNYEQASESYQRSLQLYQAMGNKFLSCRLTLELGSFLQERGDHERAFKLAESGNALARQLESSQFLWQSETLLGRAYLAQKQPEKAEQSFRLAMRTVEMLRTNVSGGEQERARFFENTLSPYHGMIELLAGQDKRFAALSVAEQSKARVLLEVLQGDKPDPAKTLPPEARTQERELINQIKDLNRRIRRAELVLPCDHAALANLISERRKVRLEFDAFQARLAATSPEPGGTGSAPPRELSQTEIAALLPDEQTALLEYVVADDKTFLFVISKDAASSLNVNVYQLPIKREDLKTKIERFRNMIAPADPAQRSHDFKTPAAELYDLLLKPAAGLQGKTSLIIIPDGELWGLPFQALQTTAKHYLIEDHALSYAPSLSTLQKMIAARGRRARVQENAGQSGAATGAQSKPLLLALGDPSLTAGDTRQAGTAAPCRALLQLSTAANEVNKLKHEIYAGSSDIYVGQAATEERFKSEAGNYRVIHLATHGLLDDADPLFSQIILAGQAAPQLPGLKPVDLSVAATPQKATEDGEDGVLEAWEIARLHLNADLVVLSACETARGRVGEGEGVIGLTWALAVAGTPTTVASQWSVNSRSTADLMVDFHRQLAPRMFNNRAGVGPSVALQRAALNMLKDSSKPDLQHPYFWAGFVVIGDGR